MEQPAVKRPGFEFHGEGPPREELREAQATDETGRFDDESL
jgi:hypothetical protein